MATIDLNADAGEERGDDAALFAIVTTANVAAGGHAGGGEALAEAVRLAAAAGIAVGAHPSYPDRAGFGRVSRAHDHDAAGVSQFVRTQVLVVAEACRVHGIGLSHVKAHGALYNDIAADTALASAVLDGVRAAAAELGEPGLAVMGMPESALQRVCRRFDVPFHAEAYADRAYRSDGSLVPRGEPGAVLHDPDVVADRVLRVATDGVVQSVEGTLVPVPAVTVCIHGDTAGSVGIARRVRARLEDNGVRIARVGATQ